MLSVHSKLVYPKIIAANIGKMVGEVLRTSPWKQEEIGTWAVHPGGRSIVDRIEKALNLNPEQLEDSRETLRQYGNMSSVTVLFVLHRILNRDGLDKNHPICAMAFGPGLTIETALMEYHPAATPPNTAHGK